MSDELQVTVSLLLLAGFFAVRARRNRSQPALEWALPMVTLLLALLPESTPGPVVAGVGSVLVALAVWHVRWDLRG